MTTGICQTCKQPLHVVGPVWFSDKGRYHLQEPDDRGHAGKCYVDG